MSSRRLAKVNEAIRETVASEILLRVRDPRVKSVTVLRAEASADLRTAKVYVSVMGDDKVQSLSMHGLRSACGYLQSKLADRLQTRCTPVLTFVLDPSVKISLATSSLIRSALADGVASPGAAETDEDDFDDETSNEGVEDEGAVALEAADGSPVVEGMTAGDGVTAGRGSGSDGGTAHAKEACAEMSEPPSG